MLQFLKKTQTPNLIVTAVISFIGLSFIIAEPAFAQTPAPHERAICEGSGGEWTPAAGNGGSCSTPGSVRTVPNTIRRVVEILIFVIGAVSIIMVVIGGLRYVLSGGDEKAVSAAKNTILFAIVGIIISVAAYAIVSFVLTNLGVN